MPVQEQKTQHLLRDLAIYAVHRELRPVYRLSEGREVSVNGRDVQWDFLPREGKENLMQAVIMRLLTPRGELAALGHPTYGARVHELIGRENNARNRNLLKLYVIEALKNEPRIAKIIQIEVYPSPGTRGTVDVLIVVQPAGATDLVRIGPFSLVLNP